MKFTLEINMDNAAFDNGNGDKNSCEVIRLLQDLTAKLSRRSYLDTDSCGVFVDINGNKVGTWEVTE